MRDFDQNNPDVIQFGRSNRATDRNDNQVDQVGEAMLQLLGRASDFVESNHRQAQDKAQQLAHELHHAHDRIRQLEGEMAAMQERADHAEHWLHRVHTEIEERFLNKEHASRSRSLAK
jgi:predicted  nucleic acid-binding Zn-ribbon protein